MDTPALGTTAAPDSEAYARNATSHAELVEDLRKRLASARLGGPEKSRTRHVERGKLLSLYDSVDLTLGARPRARRRVAA